MTYRIRVLRRLAAHAVAHRSGEYVHSAWPDHEKWSSDWEKETAAWRNFTDHSNAALQPFHVRVWADVGGSDYDIGSVRPTAYEAAVLQVVNDLVEEVDYRTCAHCGRTFARQIGRSEHHSRSSGVMYSTASCARAAEVRAYRARKRAERNES